MKHQRAGLAEMIRKLNEAGLSREKITERAQEKYAESSVRTAVSRFFVNERRERRRATGAGRHRSIPSPEEQRVIRLAEKLFGKDAPKHLQAASRHAVRIEFPLTVGEIDNDPTYPEGAKERVLVNRYERDKKAIAACKKHYGVKCCVCHMGFEDAYGMKAKDYIQVHHLVPLSKAGKRYNVDPVKDLRPVCPNCHAVIHMHKPMPYTLKEVRAMLE
jgi:hypothetical protein